MPLSFIDSVSTYSTASTATKQSLVYDDRMASIHERDVADRRQFREVNVARTDRRLSSKEATA